MLIIGKHDQFRDKNMTRIGCLSGESARQILEIRWHTRLTAPVHACGRIQAASPVTQIKDCPLFLVKLLPGVDIIIKRKELLQWHEHLVPNKEFVITNLRPTTLQKGGTRQSRVYTVTSSSQLLTPEDVTVEWVSLQKWLELNKLSCPASATSTVPLPADTLSNKLFSYQGTVSQVLDRALGVFELDNNVRVHVGQVPAVPSFSAIQVGEKLTVHNAHHRQNTQGLVLYGCMLCSITQHKQAFSEISKTMSLSPVLQKYLYLYQLSQHKLDFLYKLRQTLDTQLLGGVFDSRGVEKIFTTILAVAKLSWQQSSKGPYRNLLDEFLNVPHACSLQGAGNEERLPEYVTIREVLDSVTQPAEDAAGQWTFNREFHKQQVLLGMLSSCERTGQWLLYDNTGTVIIVPCCIHSNNIKNTCSEKHTCSHQCCCKNIKKGSQFPCKRLHTCCFGKVVAIRKFLPVLETVNYSLPSPALSGNKHGACLKYLWVDLEELVVLGDKSLFEKQVEIKQPIDLGNKLITEKQIENKTLQTQDKCTKHHSLGATNRQATNDGVIEKNLQSSASYGPSNIVPVFEKCGGHSKPLLHRHVQEDGSTRFCRKTDCATIVGNPGEAETEREKAKENIPDVACEKENTNISDGNGKKMNGTILIDKTVEDEMSNFSFSVKPVVRKRVGNCTVTSLEHSQCTKHLDGSSRRSNKKRACNTSKREHMPSDFDKVTKIYDCDISLGLMNEKQKTDNISNSVATDVRVTLVQDRDLNADKNVITIADTDKREITVQCTEHMVSTLSCAEQREITGLIAKQRDITVPFAKQREDTVPSSSIILRVLNKEALRQDRQTPTSKALMTCVDCVLLRDANLQQAKLMLQGSSLKWYPGLYPGHTYCLSVPDGSSPLLTPHPGNKKLRQTVERSNTQLWRVVHDAVHIEELFESRDEDFDKGSGSAEKQEKLLGKDFADVEGMIIRRALVKRDQQQPSMQDHSRGDNVNTRLDVRETISGKIVQVYLDHGNIFLLLGLIPGALVSLRRLERVVSRSGNVYYRLAHVTSTLIKCITTSLCRTQPEGVPATVVPQSRSQEPVRLYLVEMWKEESGEPVWKWQGQEERVFECVCQVCQVAKLSLKCVCEFCGSTVVKSRCSNTVCFGGESAVFLAKANVIVDDGTSVAMVTMSGECVRNLLQLSEDQWSALEQESKMTGEVFVQQAKRALDSPMEQLAYMLCDNRLVKRPWLMRLRRRAAGKDSLHLDKIDLDEFAQKNFDVGSTQITTHCLPFLQLECIAMETFNPTTGSNCYIAIV